MTKKIGHMERCMYRDCVEDYARTNVPVNLEILKELRKINEHLQTIEIYLEP